jgi:DNA ligase-1
MRESARFSDFAETMERVRATSSKNAKVEALAGFLGGLGPEDSETVARLSTGRPSARGSKDEVQVGYSTITGVLEEVCGATRSHASRIYLKFGDLGEAAEELLQRKTEVSLFAEELRIADLEHSFERMRSAKGRGSADARRGEVKSLLLRATPLEGKYIVKALTGEMRTGLVGGLLEEAIAKSHGIPKESVAKAHLLLGDSGLLAGASARGEIGSVKMLPFRPVNFMLAEPLATPKEVAGRFGKPVFAECKYDGVRAQVHKLGDRVRIYSRRLEEITSSFPEVAAEARMLRHDFVMDGEIVAFKDGRPLPFQLLQRRLRRMEGFEEAAKKAPVSYFAFDLLMLDGDELYERPLTERTEQLGALVAGSGIPVAQRVSVAGEDEVQAAFRMSRDLGYEGLVLKDPASSYTMGKRGLGWAKLKEELDTIDAVIVAAEYGHGKRAGVISDYTFAVKDGPRLVTIGKAYSGLTDEEIAAMTERLKRITIVDHGYWRSVKPEIVLEVAFDSVQRSDRHDSGFALRFPRIKRLREDKSAADADTLERVRSIFENQRVRLDEQ